MPIAMQSGFGPLGFAILMSVNLQTSFLPPLFGYARCYFAGVAPAGYPMMPLCPGIIAFVFLQLMGLMVIGVFPRLATYLSELFSDR